MSTKYRIAHLNDIAPGEKKSCPIDDDHSVLLVNAEGELVTAVVLDNGARLDAHLAVIGVGVRPVTGFLQHVAVNDDGSVNVDDHLRVEEFDDLFAAGDVAQCPDWRGGGRARIEHWRVAGQQGRIAALNMLDRDKSYRHVPFFWTDQYMVITDYLGHASEWDEVIVEGSLDERQFVVYYILHGQVQAVASCGASDTMLRISEALAQTPLPTVDDLRSSLQIFTETSPRREGA
jgi:apoptosis-inducing factor 3